MTSSPGMMPPTYNAVVQRNDQGIGPIRLPIEQQRQFIDEFNERYRGLGISVSRAHGASDANHDDNGSDTLAAQR